MDTLFLKWPPTAESLQEAYRRRSLRCHPDRGGTYEAFLDVKRARDFIAELLERGLPTEASVQAEAKWAEAEAKRAAAEAETVGNTRPAGTDGRMRRALSSR
jgi:hypothetical protein